MEGREVDLDGQCTGDLYLHKEVCLVCKVVHFFKCSYNIIMSLIQFKVMGSVQHVHLYSTAISVVDKCQIYKNSIINGASGRRNSCSRSSQI